MSTEPLGDSANRGLLRSSAGSLTTIDVGAPGAYGTQTLGTTGDDLVVGTVCGADCREHGFPRTAAHAFATIDVPGGTDAAGGTVSGNNRAKHIGGSCFERAGYDDDYSGLATAH